MAGKSMGDRVFSNLIWRFAERTGAQAVAFIVSIILARMLEPSMYGIIALVTVFISILNVFVDSGLGNSLIQKKGADSIDFSTVFYSKLVICLVLYMLLFIAAPFIAKFYKMEELTSVTRVMGLQLIISGIKGVQHAYVSKHMMFKRFFFATLGGTIGAAVVGIIMAYLGFGVWALVTQHMFNLIVDTIILWITVKWRPTCEFSFQRLKRLFSYGWRLLIAKLLDTLYQDIRQLVIGKMYTSKDLALYNRGKGFPDLIAININNSIDSVLFPAMSFVQDSKQKMRQMTRTSIRVSGYLMWPMMVGLSVVAEPLIKLLLTEKWLGCVPFLRVFCITCAFQPLHTANLNAIKAMGRSDLLLRMEIVKKITGLCILLVAMQFGVLMIAYSLLVYNVFAQIVNAWPNRKLMNYNSLDQLKDTLPFIGISFIMAIPVYFLGFLPLPTVLVLALQVVAGGLIYLIESLIFKLDIFTFILDRVKMLFKR